jgi:RNA polymerase sigma-70 factor (ECF subfamily)
MHKQPLAPSDQFIHLLTSHQTQLRGVIMAGLGNNADCQDVLQKTNLAIWKKAGEFDESRSFLAWAIGIARFEILAFIRDRQRDRHVFSSEVAEMLVGQAEEAAPEIPARQLALRDCLAELPAASRDLLSLKYFRGQTTVQISEATGRSLDGVKSFLLRVRKLLAECIQRRLATAADF